MRRLVLILCALVVLAVTAGCESASNLTAEEDAYLDALTAQTDALDDSVDRFAGLMDPTGGGGPDWVAAIVAETRLWQDLYRDAQRLVPPARFAEVNAKNLEMLGLLATAAGELSFAVQRTDPVYLAEGFGKFVRATELAGEVERMVKDAR